MNELGFYGLLGMFHSLTADKNVDDDYDAQELDIGMIMLMMMMRLMMMLMMTRMNDAQELVA